MTKSMLKSTVLVVSLSMSTNLYANDIAKAAVITDKKVAEAYELLESMNMDSTYDKMIDQMLGAQSAMIPVNIRENKELLKQYNSVLSNFIKKYVAWDNVRNDIAGIYAKYYSLDELKEIKNFYMTAVGQKTIELMPKVSAESMKITQSKMMSHMDELKSSIAKLINNELKKEETETKK